MSDSWIVIEDNDESEYVLIDADIDKQTSSPASKRPLGQQNHQPTMINLHQTQKQQNKKRKWKVLYSLPSTNIQGNVDKSNLDSFVMDQHAQLFDKRDLFGSQQQFVKVK